MKVSEKLNQGRIPAHRMLLRDADMDCYAIMHFGHYPDIRNEKGYIKLENGHIEANKAVWELERAGPD